MVNIIEDFRLALSNLRRRKLRSFLTILAIVVGMGAVVMFITLGDGIRTGINEQFELMGSDKIFISPSTSLLDFGGATSTLTEDDVKLIDDVSGVNKVAGMVIGIVRTVYKDEQAYLWLGGMEVDDFEIFESQGFGIEDGRLPDDDEKGAIAVGWLHINGKIFEEETRLGKKYEIEDKEYKIVGSFDQVGNSQDDSTIWVPLGVAREILGKEDQYDYLFIQVSQGEDAGVIAEEIKEELRDDRNLKEGEEDFSVQTSEELIETFNSVLGVLFIAIIGIASISLLVGGIGVMNTMFTSVLDRTREIGVMKAIGATNRDVLSIFVIEAGFLGLIGGAIGIVIGVMFSLIIEYMAINYFLTTLVQVYVNPWVIVGVLAFSFVIGVVSGFIPARRAAEMSPIEALRYE